MSRLRKGSRNIQPFLVVPRRTGIYYIVADDHLIQIEDNAIIAFNILLKLHYCFDVEFTSNLVNFYDFITGCMNETSKTKSM